MGGFPGAALASRIIMVLGIFNGQTQMLDQFDAQGSNQAPFRKIHHPTVLGPLPTGRQAGIFSKKAEADRRFQVPCPWRPGGRKSGPRIENRVFQRRYIFADKGQGGPTRLQPKAHNRP